VREKSTGSCDELTEPLCDGYRWPGDGRKSVGTDMFWRIVKRRHRVGRKTDWEKV